MGTFSLLSKNIADNIHAYEVIRLLKSALADEFIASQNYFMQAKLLAGGKTINKAIQKELFQHQKEEEEHAGLLIDRMLELGATSKNTPEIRPTFWDKKAKCLYKMASSWEADNILNDAISGEKCAIKHYEKISKFVKNKDQKTFDLIQHIIDDEREHIDDLNKLFIK